MDHREIVKLTAKVIGSPADRNTLLRTGLCIGCDDITEACAVSHWRTRARCVHTHLYVWFCIHLKPRRHRNRKKKEQAEFTHWRMHVRSLDVTLLTCLLHSLKRGPVITWHDCSTVNNLMMLSLQGAGIWTHTYTVIQESITCKSCNLCNFLCFFTNLAIIVCLFCNAGEL